jgi:hypothetical protein
MIFPSNTILIYSSCSIKFLNVSVCCVVLLPFLTWLATATNAIAVGLNINANLFANAAAVMQLLQSCRFYCGHCYCHCHRCWVEVYFKIIPVASTASANTTAIVTTGIAIVGPSLSLLAAVTIVWQTIAVKIDVSRQYYIFFSFCFGDDDGDGDGKGNGNDDGNGNGDGRLLFTLWLQWDNSSDYILFFL